MSEWEHIFKGETVDLDQILSSLHCITIDPERKACIGDTEISIGSTETKRRCAARLVKGGCLAKVLYSVLGVLCVAWSLSRVKLASALIVKDLRKGKNAKQGV